jgi:hypothetical protein
LHSKKISSKYHYNVLLLPLTFKFYQESLNYHFSVHKIAGSTSCMNSTNKNVVAADALQATMNAGGGHLLDLLHHAMVALLHPLAVTKPSYFLATL